MRRLLLACSFALAALIAQPSAPASAQEPAAKAARNKRAKQRAKRAKKEEPKAPAPAAETKANDKEAAVPSGEGVAPKTEDKASESTSSALGGGEEQVRKEGDTEVKTVEFTGLDIEGQLKTPQLLYFLTRLRAEFDRPRLPHRSFMPELSRTTGEKSLR